MNELLKSGLKAAGRGIDKRLPKHWKPVAAIATVGLVCATGNAIHATSENDKNVGEAGDVAMAFALGRGACKLTSAKETVVKGKHMLTLGMELDSRFNPEDIEDRQLNDPWFMGAAFHDNPGKYGVAVNRITQAKTPASHVAQPKPPVNQRVVKGTNSSFEGTDTITIAAPTNLTPETYEVSRLVGVTAETTGKLVRDQVVDAVAQISCGTFIDYPNRQPVVQ